MKNDGAALAQKKEQKQRQRPFSRKSRVSVPAVAISPTTLKIMEENERILKKYRKK